MTDINILHVYSAEHEHDPVFIVGNVTGLTALRDSLDRVLKRNEETSTHLAFVADGEGYELTVIKIKADWQSKDWQGLMLPYHEYQIIREGKHPAMLSF